MKTKRGHRPYAPNWYGPNGIAARTCKATFFRRCCFCLFRRATLAHHLYYCFGLWNKPIYGKEVSGRDTVGVCDGCHGILHSNKCWQHHPKNPDRDRNTPQIISQLRFNFFLLSALNYWWIVAIAIFVILKNML